MAKELITEPWISVEGALYDLKAGVISVEDALGFIKSYIQGVGMEKCTYCGAPFAPAEECVSDHTGKWDGHTYKGTCQHFPKDIRISIG